MSTGQSRFDQFRDKHDPLALTDQEQWGFRIFVRKAGCAGCHLVNGPHPRFTDDEFHSIGIGENDPTDLGREDVTGKIEDRWHFKTPGLRNVALRPYLMHNGSMSDLREVVQYYNKGGHVGSHVQDPRLVPLHLTEPEIDAVVVFLRALTDDPAGGAPWRIESKLTDQAD